jgi:hypothetical protein
MPERDGSYSQCLRCIRQRSVEVGLPPGSGGFAKELKHLRKAGWRRSGPGGGSRRSSRHKQSSGCWRWEAARGSDHRAGIEHRPAEHVAHRAAGGRIGSGTAIDVAAQIHQHFPDDQNHTYPIVIHAALPEPRPMPPIRGNHFDEHYLKIRDAVRAVSEIEGAPGVVHALV